MARRRLEQAAIHLALSNQCVNSMAEIMASDAAVVASIALQYKLPRDAGKITLLL